MVDGEVLKSTKSLGQVTVGVETGRDQAGG